jgi:signal transduction histidine kinase
MALPRSQLAARDWLLLLASLISGAGAGALGLALALRLLLEPNIVEETALRLAKHVQLVEQVLQQVPPDALPAGVLVRREGQIPPADPAPLPRFDRLVQDKMGKAFGLARDLRRDQPPLQDAWGGHWVRLQSRWTADAGPLWLYHSQRLSNSLWYLPLLRILAILIGTLAGLVLFLRLWVERPLSTLLRQLESQGAATSLALLPEHGIQPIRLLSVRVNRLLERINNTARARRQLLQGLTHDLGGPHGRLMLRTELLCEQLQGETGQLAEAMARDLQRLRSLTDQLALLGEQELPGNPPPELCP